MCEVGVDEIINPGWSNRQGQLVDGSQNSEGEDFLGPQFVVATADVLDEHVDLVSGVEEDSRSREESGRRGLRGETQCSRRNQTAQPQGGR